MGVVEAKASMSTVLLLVAIAFVVEGIARAWRRW
jgi:hypothetical protein